MTPGLSLDQLTRQILHYEDLAIEHAEHACKFKVEVGHRLIAAKALLPHGQFIPWSEKTFGWNRRHTLRHMILARNWSRVSHLPGDSSLRMALAAIADSTRRGAIAALLAGGAVAGTGTSGPDDDFDQRLIHFNNLWCKYIRLHFGCLPDDVNISQCKPYKGVLAVKEFGRAAAAGRKLFKE